MVQKSALIQTQAKPKDQRKITYFCRLCREYGVKSRKAHLKNYHGAHPDAVSKRVPDDIIEVLFVQSR